MSAHCPCGLWSAHDSIPSPQQLRRSEWRKRLSQVGALLLGDNPQSCSVPQTVRDVPLAALEGTCLPSCFQTRPSALCVRVWTAGDAPVAVTQVQTLAQLSLKCRCKKQRQIPASPLHASLTQKTQTPRKTMLIYYSCCSCISRWETLYGFGGQLYVDNFWVLAHG